MPPVGFEPTISAGERPQTYALDRAAIGCRYHYLVETFSSEIFYVNHSSLRRNMNQGGVAIHLLPSIRVTQTDGRHSSELNKV